LSTWFLKAWRHRTTDGYLIDCVGSTSGFEGLAMVRLDRLEEARAAGVALKAGDVTAEVT
jgi:hypothetical protein